MSSTVANCKRSRSASAIIADTASGYHILRIDGYSRTKGAPTGVHLNSLPFTVGGHCWYIRYYPNGDKSDFADYISLYLRLADESAAKAVKAQFEFSVLGEALEPTLTLGPVHGFESHCGWGSRKLRGMIWRNPSIFRTILLPSGATCSSSANSVPRRPLKPLLRNLSP